MHVVETLLKQMTLAEKAGQMTQVTMDTLCKGEIEKLDRPLAFDEVKLNAIVRDKMVGSVLNVPSGFLPSREEWQELVRHIQQKAAETRLGIPVIYGIDAIHGVNYCRDATLFPQPLAMAATFNLMLAEQLAAVTAYECRAAGLPWNFSPALDVGRNPVWPRLWESFGEDVLVNTLFGKATVSGYQGAEPGHPYKVAACLKHFTGYGMPLSGKDRTPAWIPERYLREYFLPAFAAAIRAGAKTIMINSGEINGVPVHADRWLLTEVLRNELGFQGVAVTDWWDIVFLHTRHRVAPTLKEAVRIAVDAGIDMSMTPYDTEFTDLLIELVEEGAIAESRLDESVRRILTLKADLGLLAPSEPADVNFSDFAGKLHSQLSAQAAEESIILLKNNQQTLPLSPTSRLLVVGPAADNQRALNGGWTSNWQGDMADAALAAYPTFLDALRERFGANQVTYVPGAGYDQEGQMQDAIWGARDADAIIVCLGEDSYCEFQGNIHDLALPAAQRELALAIGQTGKPLILVLLQGRPRLIPEIEPLYPAIITAFYPGPQGGKALAAILAGDSNPSGKLPITYPRYAHSLVPYDHKPTEDHETLDYMQGFVPLFPFGHGLSYSQFTYHRLTLSSERIQANELVQVKVDVHNAGDRTGFETVLVFVSDQIASITPAVKRLRAFRKISLNAGETQTVEFTLKPVDLAFVGQQNQWMVEAGSFTVKVGNLEAEFILEEGTEPVGSRQ